MRFSAAHVPCLPSPARVALSVDSAEPQIHVVLSMSSPCYWADPSDVVASSEASSGPLLSPPSNWPASFKENKLLKSFMGKQLKGTRVRLTGVPSSDDAARVEHVALASNDSFGNAEAVHLALGWEVIKGFAVPR